MFFVSTSDASPRSGASWATGMSVLTVALERLDEVGQARDEVLRIGLLAQREQDALLAQAAIEVVRAVPRACVAERLGAVHVLDAGRDIDPPEAVVDRREAVVGDRHLDVDGHAAHRVDDLLEAVEVDLDEVLDVEPVQVAHDRLEPVVAGQVALVPGTGRCASDRRPPGVDLAGVDRAEGAPRWPGRGRHVHRVARQAEHRDLLGDRIDRHDDEGVRVVGGFARSLVAPDEQDVEPLLAVPRRDRDVGRAVPAGVASGSGLSVGSTEPATVGVGDPFGEGDASAEQSVELDVSPMKMQSLSRTSRASMS